MTQNLVAFMFIAADCDIVSSFFQKKEVKSFYSIINFSFSIGLPQKEKTKQGAL